MGYTHYWYIGENAEVPPEAFGKLALDAKHLFEVAKEQGIDLADGLGDGDPIINEGLICFNGRAPDEDYETWVLQPTDHGFNFCKTREPERPYDAVVNAILIRAKHIYGPAIRVASDGDWNDWERGAKLYELTFGEPAFCPFEEKVNA